MRCVSPLSSSLAIKIGTLLMTLTLLQDARAQDPVISIKICAGTQNATIAATFDVTNKGNKTLVNITLYAFRNTGVLYYSAAKDIVDGKIPSIDVGITGATNYNCLAVLKFKDGNDTVRTASQLKPDIFATGPADNTDYGTLKCSASTLKDTVELVTSYFEDAGKKWAPGANDATTWLIPSQGGRFAPVTATKQTGTTWLTKYANTPNGTYLVFGFLEVTNGTNTKEIASKLESVKVVQEE